MGDENVSLTEPARVAPVLDEAIKSGKINLTAIVNTHQSVSNPAPVMSWILG